MIIPTETNNSCTASDEEIKAQHLMKDGQIDEAIAIYQSLAPHSSRILHLLGVLYAEKKGDYQSAINYYKQAIQIQEENDEDSSDTLSELGFAYQNVRDFEMALAYHLQALHLRKSLGIVNQKSTAFSLLGLANAHWGLENLSEALTYAQRALTLNKSVCDNDQTIAANLAILANIYHHLGDNIRALESANQALVILERYSSSDPSALVTLLNNIGTIQVTAGMLNDAQLTFIRVLNIYEKTLPEGHYTRLTIENNVQRITEMNRVNMSNIFDRFRNLLTKSLLF